MTYARKQTVKLVRPINLNKLILALRDHLKCDLAAAKSHATNLPHDLGLIWPYEAREMLEKFGEYAEMEIKDVLVQEDYNHGSVQICSGFLEEALQWYRSLPPETRKLAELVGYLVHYKLI